LFAGHRSDELTGPDGEILHTVDPDRDAVDDHVANADGLVGGEPRRPRWEVGHPPNRPRRHGCRIEHHDIGPRAGNEATAMEMPSRSACAQQTGDHVRVAEEDYGASADHEIARLSLPSRPAFATPSDFILYT